MEPLGIPMPASSADLVHASLHSERSPPSMVDGIPIGTNEFDWCDWRPSRRGRCSESWFYSMTWSSRQCVFPAGVRRRLLRRMR